MRSQWYESECNWVHCFRNFGYDLFRRLRKAPRRAYRVIGFCRAAPGTKRASLTIQRFLPPRCVLSCPVASKPVAQQTTTTTIDCVYDKLNRLTEANYSINDMPGNYYYYEYDAAGNRKKQTAFVGGVTSVTNYIYDSASRLTCVNGIEYEYDFNSKLLNDGMNDYEYDSANSLVSFTNATTNSTNRYNGLNDRL